MLTAPDSAELAALVDTLIEGQALLVSSIYIDLINLGLIEAGTAASRLRALAKLADSPLQRHPAAAAALGQRMNDYAEGLSRMEGGTHEARLRLVLGGRTD